jgi:predicted DNA-binding transcriptional regulator AlpA
VNRTPEIIATLRAEMESAPRSDLPSIIAALAGLSAEAHLLLTAPPPAGDGGAAIRPDDADELLDVHEAAQLLRQKVAWVYAHQDELPRVKIPGRGVRFSRRKLRAWIDRRSRD